MTHQDLVFRLLRQPLKLLSLRSIVIVGQVGVIILVLTLGVWVWVGVTNDQYNQLDRRLDSLSSLGDVNTLLRSAQQSNGVGPQPTEGGLVRTARIGDTTVSIPRCPKYARQKGIWSSIDIARGSPTRTPRPAPVIDCALSLSSSSSRKANRSSITGLRPVAEGFLNLSEHLSPQ